MAQSYLVSTKICMTKDVGTHGNLFGGNMLAWMDEAAAAFARKYTGEKHLVTIRLSEVIFKVPVKVGELVEFCAMDPKIGRTSITFDLEGKVRSNVVFRTTCTFVALDEDGKPKEIQKHDHDEWGSIIIDSVKL